MQKVPEGIKNQIILEHLENCTFEVIQQLRRGFKLVYFNY